MYDKQKLNTLSDREREVFFLIAKGMTNGEIAKKCFISLDTVKSHTRRLYKKLGIKNRSQIVIYAFVTEQIEWNEQEGKLLCQEK